ncbi:MAG: O-antigen ligase family protein [Chloroflexi bacterium]|nr:O-antigen ligase family protein [Chloroflexota bacterium]
MQEAGWTTKYMGVSPDIQVVSTPEPSPSKATGLTRLIAFLSSGEPFLITLATASVFVLSTTSIMLGWIGVGICFAPLAVRLARRNWARLRTPFDVPVLLMLAGGVVGVVSSPTFDISIRSMQTLLSCTALYYSICACLLPRAFIKWAVVLFTGGVFLAVMFAVAQQPVVIEEADGISSYLTRLGQNLPKLPQISGQASPPLTLNHGLALSMLIAASFVVGLAAFSKRITLRIGLGLVSVIFLWFAVTLTNQSLLRLVMLESVKGRIPVWLDTINMIRQHPLTGLGLGSWATLYHPDGTIDWLGHPHNAYLELYSNFGILGAMALIGVAGIGAREGWRIVTSMPRDVWYGFGVGVLAACILTFLIGFLESAPVGMPASGANRYLYTVSPVWWMLLALLVLARRAHRDTTSRQGP